MFYQLINNKFIKHYPLQGRVYKNSSEWDYEVHTQTYNTLVVGKFKTKKDLAEERKLSVAYQKDYDRYLELYKKWFEMRTEYINVILEELRLKKSKKNVADITGKVDSGIIGDFPSAPLEPNKENYQYRNRVDERTSMYRDEVQLLRLLNGLIDDKYEETAVIVVGDNKRRINRYKRLAATMEWICIAQYDRMTVFYDKRRSYRDPRPMLAKLKARNDEIIEMFEMDVATYIAEMNNKK